MLQPDSHHYLIIFNPDPGDLAGLHPQYPYPGAHLQTADGGKSDFQVKTTRGPATPPFQGQKNNCSQAQQHSSCQSQLLFQTRLAQHVSLSG